MPIFIFNEDDAVASVLDNNAPGSGVFFDDMHISRVDGFGTYEFSCPADCEQAAFLLPGRQILVNDNRGNLHLFNLMTIDEIHNDSGFIKKCKAEVGVQELNANIIHPCTMANASVQTMMTAILNGTRWQLGNVDYDGQYTLKVTDYPTVMATIRRIQELSGHEIQYRYDFNGSRITGRYIDMVSALGEYTGKYIDYTKDMKGFTRTGDASAMATALIGLGKNGLTFTDEVWTETASHPAKPSGQDWIGDDEARELYGIPDGAGGKRHIFGVYVNDQETDASKLLSRTYSELKKRSGPAFTYNLDMLMLDSLPSQGMGSGFAFEKVGLGDTVVVRDLTFDPPLCLAVRVIELRRSYSDVGASGMKV